jgi:hypothetical protein
LVLFFKKEHASYSAQHENRAIGALAERRLSPPLSSCNLAGFTGGYQQFAPMIFIVLLLSAVADLR